MNNIYFKKLGLNTEDVFELIDFHDNYKDLYPGYLDPESENEYEDDYYFNSKDDAYESVNDILNFFNSLPEPLDIHRTIKVKSLDDINFDYLGDSWSFDKQSVINFANIHGLGNVLLSAKTKFDNIDWEATLKLFFQFSFLSGGSEEKENEIKIIDTDKLTLVDANYIK